MTADILIDDKNKEHDSASFVKGRKKERKKERVVVVVVGREFEPLKWSIGRSRLVVGLFSSVV